jgi:hypothetical protein
LKPHALTRPGWKLPHIMERRPNPYERFHPVNIQKLVYNVKASTTEKFTAGIDNNYQERAY